MTTQDASDTLNAELAGLSAPERLAHVASAVEGRIVFTTSFGMEDQIITHMICSQNLDIDIVTLDTGRMFEQTYEVWAKTEAQYGRKIVAFSPEAEDLRDLLSTQGINGFYESVGQRKACCNVRKVIPLARALKGAQHWVTGIRAEQSSGRSGLTFTEYLEDRGLIKSNPLLDWTKQDMVDFLAANPDVPVNSLHAQGFPSIGCAPCTRAITEGEDDRAGRWWWEDDNQECGLHVGPDGRLVRMEKSEKEVI